MGHEIDHLMGKEFTTKKVGIFGVGAIGSVLSKNLSQLQNIELYYFNRSPKSKVAIEFNGILFEEEIQLSLPRTIRVKLDWLLICLKEYQYFEAYRDIEAIVTNSHTKIAIFRNGLNLKDEFLKMIDAENILETIIDCPIEKRARKPYVQFSKPKITIPQIPIASRFLHLIQNSDLHCTIEKDFKTVQWKKLIESACLGALQVKSGNTCGSIKHGILRKHYENLLHECIEVATLDGADISKTFTTTLLQKLDTYPDSKASSMFNDFKSGNKIEINAKNGIILKLAEKYGLSTPLNAKLTAYIEEINENL